jgi:hypothetical protein
MNYNLKSYLIICGVFLLSACSCNPTVKNKAAAEKITVNLHIVRFEQLLFSPQKDIHQIAALYPSFFDFYTARILNIVDKNDSAACFKKLNGFVNNSAMQGLYDTTQKYYANFSRYELALHDAFQWHKFYFPNEKVPGIYTYIAEFGYGIAPSDTMLGIGLDMFLGKQYPFYRSPQIDFPNFLINKCTAENLVPSAMKGWANYIIKTDRQHRRLIDRMVEQGKIMYYLDKVMPELPDSMKISYSGEQLKWCEWNMYKIWEYFIKHELLYKSDMMEIGDYVNDSPVTPGMPPDAPGNIGTWTGWQIVKKYMDENPKVTMEQLFNETDGQKILTASHFKPKKK